jgi:hypothetical protein
MWTAAHPPPTACAGGSFALWVPDAGTGEEAALVPVGTASLEHGIGSPQGSGEPDIDFIRIVEAHYGPAGGLWTVGLSSGCLLSLALAQIVVGAQVMDGFLIWMAGKSCAVEYGWSGLRGVCTSHFSLQPFGAGERIVSLGFVICMVTVCAVVA